MPHRVYLPEPSDAELLKELLGEVHAYLPLLDRGEMRRDLDGALQSLPSSLREAFVMKHVEGRSYEEMAVLLDTTVGALKMRVHRAREALQALLEERYQ